MNVEQRIECNTSGKLIARISAKGIKLWCDQHKREELITWEQLDTLRDSLLEITISNQAAIISQ